MSTVEIRREPIRRTKDPIERVEAKSDVDGSLQLTVRRLVYGGHREERALAYSGDTHGVHLTAQQVREFGEGMIELANEMEAGR